MQISPIQYRQYTFTGLTKKLSKSAYDASDIESLSDKYEKSNGIIGNLPSSWINRIPYEKREECIKNIYNGIGKIFTPLRDEVSSPTLQYHKTRELSSLLKKNHVINKGSDVSLEYVDSGAYGKVFRLGVKDEDYAVKVFILKDSDDIHGNYIEQGRALYINKNIPAKCRDWARFYYGDVKNGIMMSEFVQKNKSFDGDPYDLRKIGLLDCGEHSNIVNQINGIKVDYGAIEQLQHPNKKSK